LYVIGEIVNPVKSLLQFYNSAKNSVQAENVARALRKSNICGYENNAFQTMEMKEGNF
jgi:hypothetical protein